MTIYEGNTIYHTHGDTLVSHVSMANADRTPYVIQAGDRVVFRLKRNDGEAPIIEKNIPTDSLILRLESEETKALGWGVNNGHYKYDLELQKADGMIDTFVNMADLYILEEV